MFCSNCGNPLNDNSKFCSHCGKQTISTVGNPSKQTTKKGAVYYIAWIVAGIVGYSLGSFFGIVFFLFFVAAFLATWFYRWYIKRANEKVLNFIAWSNILTWILPILGIFTVTVTFNMVRNYPNKKDKLYVLAIIGLLFSLINAAWGYYIKR